MQLRNDRQLFFAVALSMGLHAVGFVLTGNLLMSSDKPEDKMIAVEILLPEKHRPMTAPRSPVPEPAPAADSSLQLPGSPAAARPPASQAAPAAPTAEEWAFAARYTLKNSKGYRHSWGKQVRSMMGTAVEGPDQGAVRFRVEIAPDGTLAKLETLWATSAVAEERARRAIRNLPPLPPTPTGKPLIFDKTIVFSAFAADSPPLYKDDCVPDPPVFRSPYTWDGKSPQVYVVPKPVEQPDPQAIEECLKQLPEDSIEAEAAQNHRRQEAVRY